MSPSGLMRMGFMSTVGATRAASACTACARPISPPSAVTDAFSDMFCDLNGATRSPSRRKKRHIAVATMLLPTDDAVPCTMIARALIPSSVMRVCASPGAGRVRFRVCSIDTRPARVTSHLAIGALRVSPGEIKREPGVNPGLPRSGERERRLPWSTGSRATWEAAIARKPAGDGRSARESEDLPRCVRRRLDARCCRSLRGEGGQGSVAWIQDLPSYSSWGPARRRPASSRAVRRPTTSPRR